MSTYDLVADLPVRIDDYDLEGLVQSVSSDFERKSTIIHLRGGGEEGLGEDVVYEPVDHEIAQKAGPELPSTSRRSTPSRRPRSARSRGSIARGPTSRPPWTSRCARPAGRCTGCSTASRAR